ncbi:hypothetical protein N8608_03240, partial [bacterium]|nr:hypothetical protein [bacterium]
NDDIGWLVRDCPNIEIKGVAKPAEIGELFDEFSIAIVPHISNEKTKYMNPIKIYQYISLGIPIISSCEQNVPTNEGIFIAKTEKEFRLGVQYIENRAKQERNKSESLRQFAESNNWEKRMKQIWESLDDLIQGI